MKKLFLFLGAILLSTCLWAKQGGTLTSTPSPINPSENAVINYDGTGTNFANWEPSCYVHAWLVAAEGQEFSKSYATEWTTCNGDEEYAKLDDKVKMTYSGTKGKYSITMNIKSFFGVEDADLPKIAKLGIIVKSQWNKEDEDKNITENLFVNVGEPQPITTFDLTIVQDTMWTKDGGKIAAWVWGEELAGEWTAWATNVNDTLTLKVNEKADSIILVRNAPEAEVPTWKPWNRIDAGEIEDCHTFIITNWNEGVWCERPQPCEGQFGILVNETYIPAALNEERQDVVEYMLLDVELAENDSVQLFDHCSLAGWADGVQYIEGSYEFFIENGKFVVKEAGLYDFYFQLGSPDMLYVKLHSDSQAVENISAENTAVKFIENGEIRIRRGNQVYDVTGTPIR